jgi:hypothetical protein
MAIPQTLFEFIQKQPCRIAPDVIQQWIDVGWEAHYPPSPKKVRPGKPHSRQRAIWAREEKKLKRLSGKLKRKKAALRKKRKLLTDQEKAARAKQVEEWIQKNRPLS